MSQYLMPIRGQKKETTTTVEATGNALSSHVLEGKTFSSSSGTGLTGTMKKNTATTNKLTVSTPDFVIPSGYHDGNGIVKIVPQSKNASPDIVEQVIKADSGNVLSAVTIAPVEGTAGANNVMEGYTFASAGGIDMEGTMKNYGGVNIQPRMSTATITNILDDKGSAEFGYYGSLTIPSPVTGYVNSSTKFNIGCYGLHPDVVKAGQLIGGDNAVDSEGNKVYGTYTSDATATADSILEGETAYVNGKKIEGTIEKIKSGNDIDTDSAFIENSYLYLCIPKAAFYELGTEISFPMHKKTVELSTKSQVVTYNKNSLDEVSSILESVTIPGVPGTAGVGNVLEGKTFSSSLGINLTGTLPNYDGADMEIVSVSYDTDGGFVTLHPMKDGYINPTTNLQIKNNSSTFYFGTATKSHVLPGYTFTSKAGLCVTGTMPSYQNTTAEPSAISSSLYYDSTNEELVGDFLITPKTGYYNNARILLDMCTLPKNNYYLISQGKRIEFSGMESQYMAPTFRFDLFRGKCGEWKKIYYRLNDHYVKGNESWTIGFYVSGSIIDGYEYHEIVGEMTERGDSAEFIFDFSDKRIYLDDSTDNDIVIELNIENVTNGYIDFEYIYASKL